MSIASEIARISGAKTAIKAAIEAKGVSVPASTKIDGMAAKIAQIYSVPTVEELEAAGAPVVVAFTDGLNMYPEESLLMCLEDYYGLCVYASTGAPTIGNTIYNTATGDLPSTIMSYLSEHAINGYVIFGAAQDIGEYPLYYASFAPAKVVSDRIIAPGIEIFKETGVEKFDMYLGYSFA